MYIRWCMSSQWRRRKERRFVLKTRKASSTSRRRRRRQWSFRKKRGWKLLSACRLRSDKTWDIHLTWRTHERIEDAFQQNWMTGRYAVSLSIALTLRRRRNWLKMYRLNFPAASSFVSSSVIPVILRLCLCIMSLHQSIIINLNCIPFFFKSRRMVQTTTMTSSNKKAFESLSSCLDSNLFLILNPNCHIYYFQVSSLLWSWVYIISVCVSWVLLHFRPKILLLFCSIYIWFPGCLHSPWASFLPLPVSSFILQRPWFKLCAWNFMQIELILSRHVSLKRKPAVFLVLNIDSPSQSHAILEIFVLEVVRCRDSVPNMSSLCDTYAVHEVCLWI